MPKTGVYLGFDFGMYNIGVAIGQAITATASAIAVLKAKKGLPNWSQVDELVIKWKVEGFVVGLPVQLDGSEQPITVASRLFAKQLEERYQLPVYLVDERLTTKIAKINLKEEKSFSRHPDRFDDYAAKLILESWLRMQHESKNE